MASSVEYVIRVYEREESVQEMRGLLLSVVPMKLKRTCKREVALAFHEKTSVHNNMVRSLQKSDEMWFQMTSTGGAHCFTVKSEVPHNAGQNLVAITRFTCLTESGIRSPGEHELLEGREESARGECNRHLVSTLAGEEEHRRLRIIDHQVDNASSDCLSLFLLCHQQRGSAGILGACDPECK